MVELPTSTSVIAVGRFVQLPPVELAFLPMTGTMVITANPANSKSAYLTVDQSERRRSGRILPRGMQ